MKRAFARIALLVMVSAAVVAQTTSAAPGAAANNTPAAPHTKVAVIDMQGALAHSDEGKRDFEALAKKFEPRRIELQKLNTEIEDAKKQLNAQDDKMSPEAREALAKSIESKSKTLQSSAEDAQNEYQKQQNEVAQRILQKMVPVITKYVADNGYGLLIDASAPWPQGPVVLAGPDMDITKAVVDAYNAQSGVPKPAQTSGASTTAPKPAGTTAGAAKTPAKPH